MDLFKRTKQPVSSSFIDNPLARTKGDKIFDGVLLIILSSIFLVVAYPLYFVIISSISDPLAVASGEVYFYPIGFTLDGYRKVFEQQTVVRGFYNSLLYTSVGVAINLLVTIPTAYALSRPDFALRKPITIFYLITIFVSGGTMPTYLIVRATGLMNTMWALVIPGAITVFNTVVARTYFQTNIPLEMLEAAKLDGCGNTRFFLHVCLPISGAIIAIMVLFYGVSHWNSYFSALLYMNDRSRWPLQLELRNILLLNSLASQPGILSEEALAERKRLEALMEMIKYSLIIVSSIPMLVLYPFIQRHFVKGVMIGAIKG